MSTFANNFGKPNNFSGPTNFGRPNNFSGPNFGRPNNFSGSNFGRPNINRPSFRPSQQSWLGWLMQNRFVLIIIMILVVIIVVPWLLCDVMGLSFICTIISGIAKLFGKVFSLIGL